jgi:branched-chain amino acid aminotransferase
MPHKKILIWKLPPGENTILEPVTLAPEPGTLDEGTRLLPQGGYTTLRTYAQGRVLRLNDHFQRLEETARLAGISLELNTAKARKVLIQVQEEYPAQEKRMRIIVDLEAQAGTLYFLVGELVTPSPEEFRWGVKAVTTRMQRENPKAKLTGFIAQAAKVRHGLPQGINEALMISSEGTVLEGLSSNFFGVKDGVIYTANDGVLFGITRTMVIEVIESLGIPLVLEAISEHALGELDEVFITSASRSVLPVTEVDGKAVGNGLPGKITLSILDEYLRELDSRLEVV